MGFSEASRETHQHLVVIGADRLQCRSTGYCYPTNRRDRIREVEDDRVTSAIAVSAFNPASRSCRPCIERQVNIERSSGTVNYFRFCTYVYEGLSRVDAEISDPRAPVGTAIRGVVFLGVPHGGVVHRINGHCAVIAPAAT